VQTDLGTAGRYRLQNDEDEGCSAFRPRPPKAKDTWPNKMQYQCAS